MASPTSDIALLLFTRTPEEEVRQKALLPGVPGRAAAGVVRRLIAHTRSLARKSGLPLFVVTSAEQVGSSFGERLYHAFCSVFARGFRSVIAIGNDCPQLAAQDLQAAHQLLQQGQAVLGPATDGGVYLLGLTREQLPGQEAFTAVRWHSAQVQKDLEQVLALPGGPVALLRPLADVDEAADLHRVFRQRYLQPTLYRYLQSLLASRNSEWGWSPIFISPTLFSSFPFSFRGPPALA